MHPFIRTSIAFLAGLSFATGALAQFGSPAPTYNYPVSVVQGNQPLIAGSPVLSGSDPITLVITQPAAPNLTYPLTVTVSVSIPSTVGASPGVPIGVSAATAVGYCTLSSSTLTFSGPTATASVTVSVNVPTPVISGDYFWMVSTSNWPAGSGVVDPGAIINATVLPPILNPTVKPVITNLLPAIGASFIYTAPTPVSVPISFTATSVSTSAGGAAISSMTASFDSTPLTTLSYPIALGTTNLDGSFTSAAAVTPSIANSGPHTITVTARNAAGTTTTQTQINIFAPPSITSANATIFYYGQVGTFAVKATGYDAPTFAVTAGTLPTGVSLNPTTGILSGIPTSNAGVYGVTITATNPYGTSTQNFLLTVNPRPITVSATASSKIYGDANVALAYTITAGALVGSDTLGGALIRGAGESVGSYAISQGTLSAGSNYALSYVGANFSILAKPITVTAAGATKTYGASDPTFTYSLTSGSLVGTDSLTGVLSRAPGENVGTYGITKGTLSAGGNYALTFAGANLLITANAITVTADAKSKVYGTSDPAFTYKITSGSLVGSDTLTGSLTRATGENVSTYAITKGSLAASSNYSLSYAGALLTITQAPQTIVFGALAPVVTGVAPFALSATGGGSGNPITYSSDNIAVATVAGNLVTVVGAGTAVITANQAGNTNYSAAPAVSRALIVTAATKLNQTITFNALSPVIVGSAPFALTATASSGLTVSYTSSTPSVASVSGSTVTILSVGATTITAVQAGNNNYNAAPAVSQTLTVTAAPSCPASLMWLEPISLDKVRQGGSVLPIKFQLQECCGVPSRDSDSNGDNHSNDHSGNGDNYSNGHGGNNSADNNGDNHASSTEDHSGTNGDNHTSDTEDYSTNNVACRHGSDGRSTSDASCRHDCDHGDDDSNGCANLRDQTVVISIYEVGTSTPATQYKYGTGSPNPPDYAIDGDFQYHLNFPTAKGKRTYHIDVYRFPAGASAPVLVGSKEFKTK